LDHSQPSLSGSTLAPDHVLTAGVVREEVQEALRQQRDFTSDFRIALPDGTIKYLEVTSHH
jgi:hypothetical protein